MRAGLPGALLAAASTVAVVTLLGACGSQTRTVSVEGSPPGGAATGQTAQRPASTASTPAAGGGTSSTPAQTSTAGGTPAPSAAHTAPEPAFVEHEGSPEGLGSAVAALRARGYTASDTSTYHPDQALRVLVGTRRGSSDGYGQQAFFFVNGRFIGTDTSQPSATVKVVSQGDTEVTLAYPLYHRGDPLSSPSGGQAQVRFQLNNGKLLALGTIPPASATAPLSRQ